MNKLCVACCVICLIILSCTNSIEGDVKTMKPINCQKHIFAKKCRGASKRDVDYRLLYQNQDYEDHYPEYADTSNIDKIFVNALLDRILQPYKYSLFERRRK